MNELSVGDITAATVFQAALGVPGQVIPRNPRVASAIQRGEAVFSQIGCGDCHRTSMTLNSPNFTEPNPFNPAFNLRPQDVKRAFSFDLTRQGELPRLERERGQVVVRAFTDLKRHNMGNDPLMNNEKVLKRRPDQRLHHEEAVGLRQRAALPSRMAAPTHLAGGAGPRRRGAGVP